MYTTILTFSVTGSFRVVIFVVVGFVVVVVVCLSIASYDRSKFGASTDRLHARQNVGCKVVMEFATMAVLESSSGGHHTSLTISEADLAELSRAVEAI